MEDDAARAECYQAVRECMKNGIRAYYREFPDRLLDERSTLAIKHSVDGLEHVFAVLDRYLIVYRETPEQERETANG